MTILSPNNETTDLGGGRFSSNISCSPSFYLSNGIYKKMTDILSSSGDPNLTIGCNELFDFRVRNKLAGNSPVLHIGKGNSQVRMTPLNTANVDGVVSGNMITFPEAWNNADLRYVVGGHIIRKEIVLRSGHPTSFSFRVDNKSSNVDDDLVSSDFRMIAPYMYYPNPVGGLGSQSWYRDRPCTMTKTTQGGKRIYTITLPDGLWDGWIVDPTFTSQPDAAAGMDTYIVNSTPNTNSATNAFFAAHDFNDGYSVDIINGLIKFDLLSIPGGSTINTATLTLTMFIWDSTATLAAYRVLRSWTETSATWMKYNGASSWGTPGCENTTTDRESASVSSLSITGGATGVKDFSITASKVQEMITGGTFTNNGFLFKQTSATISQGNLFYSSDHGTANNRPKLVVDYTTGGVSGIPYSILYGNNIGGFSNYLGGV